LCCYGVAEDRLVPRFVLFGSDRDQGLVEVIMTILDRQVCGCEADYSKAARFQVCLISVLLI
jgi:hypothetical protein